MGKVSPTMLSKPEIQISASKKPARKRRKRTAPLETPPVPKVHIVTKPIYVDRYLTPIIRNCSAPPPAPSELLANKSRQYKRLQRAHSIMKEKNKALLAESASLRLILEEKNDEIIRLGLTVDQVKKAKAVLEREAIKREEELDNLISAFRDLKESDVPDDDFALGDLKESDVPGDNVATLDGQFPQVVQVINIPRVHGPARCF